REDDPDGRCLPVRGDRGRPGGRGLARGRGGPAPHARVVAVTSPTTDAERPCLVGARGTGAPSDTMTAQPDADFGAGPDTEQAWRAYWWWTTRRWTGSCPVRCSRTPATRCSMRRTAGSRCASIRAAMSTWW